MGIGAETPEWLQSAFEIGGVVVAIVIGAWGRFKSPTPTPAASRADVIDVVVREQQLNREVLIRIADSNDAMVSIMQSRAMEDRIAREIAARLGRSTRRESAPDR